MIKEIKIAENNKAIFYKNLFTKNYKDGYIIILAKQKINGRKEYLLLKDNKPIFSSQKIEDIWNKYDILKLINKNL